MDIVTHNTIARQRLGKLVPEVTLSTIEGRQLLCNGSINTFTQQRINTKKEEHAIRPSILIRDKPTFSSERMLHKDNYRKGSVE
jgi:hypothetical protein